MIAEVTPVKLEDLEEFAPKSLVADSAGQKIAIWRSLGEIVARLEDPSVPVHSAAQSLGALVTILRLLYQWDQEPSLAEMKRPQGAINLELSARREKLIGGSLETEQKQPCGWAFQLQPEHPSRPGDGQATPQKETPPLSVKQPGTLERQASLRRTNQGITRVILPLALVIWRPAKKSFERARDEHRRELRIWDKYR